MSDLDGRVVVLMPTARDGERTARVLTAAGLACALTTDVDGLCAEVDRGAGAVLLTEEAVAADRAGRLAVFLSTQPPWSDLPLVVLAREGETAAPVREAMNAILVERPVKVRSLVSVVRAALRARRRQYEVRDYLAERERQAEAVRASEERRRLAFEAAELGAWHVDPATMEFTTDPRFRAIFGVASDSLTYEQAVGVIHPDDRARVRAAMTASTRPDDPAPYAVEYRVALRDGSVRWVLAKGRANLDPAGLGRLVSFDGTVADITDRRRAESLLADQNRLLQQMLRGGTLSDVLEMLCETAESQTADGGIATVLLTDAGGKLLRPAAGRRAPAAYTAAINPVPVGPACGSCGTAAYRGEPVIVADIESDPLWADYRAAAFPHGLRACWSLPIPSSTGAVLGTFAIYSLVPRNPTGHDLRVMEFLARTAGLAVERRRADEAVREGRERLQAALDGSGCGTFRWNIQTDALDWDENLDRLFGLPPGETIRSLETFVAAVHPDDQPGVVERCRRCADEGVDFSMEFRVVWPDRSVHWLDDQGKTFRDGAGRPHYMTGMCRDVTDRKRAEDALRQLAADLSEIDRKKDDFIALLGHELRNPLAPIRTGLQVLRRTSDPNSRERSQEMMDRQLTHMVRLIDDLLDVSRIGRNKMELRRERVSLAEVIASAVETAQPALDAAGHELTVTLPSERVDMDADLTRLAQVFANLLTNSAKYTHRGGRVWLAAALDGEAVSVSVRDTGIGIPAASLPTIFDMFSQVDRSIERTTGGLGIGLALVKGLTEMHGGTVAAASDGSGSTFTVTLPALADKSGDRKVAAPGASNGRAHKILVADDNRDGAESLSQLLTILGHEVRTAHDGVEAVEAAQAYRPELILMDVGMPRLNGYEAARQIRSQQWGAGMTIVALTGWGQDGDRKLSREAGCSGHLVKPVSLPDLERILAEIETGVN